MGILLCVAVEYFIYNINNKYHFWESFFELKPLNFSEKHDGFGTFTNPLLECLNDENKESIHELSISKIELTNLINQLINLKKASSISVYVRDLNNGPWIGINEKEKFIGSSLFKVPLLMTYMKLLEHDPSILDKEILYEKKLNNDTQYFKPKKEIEVGKTYRVDDLIKYSIYYSDNNAASLASKIIKEDEFIKVFQSLGFGIPDVNNPYEVNTKTYASFFRVLFNSSYLNRNYSEKALELLTHTDFDSGLRGGVPSNIVIAHKFGERDIENTKQLHDCGIVYYPKHPYLICVMSKGDNFDKMANAISQISKFVYDQVNKNL